MSSPLRDETLGDLVKARQQRLVAATRYAEQHAGMSPELREAIAAWIGTGGEPPWATRQETGGHRYPPVEPGDGPRA